jgi:hypothetical protein
LKRIAALLMGLWLVVGCGAEPTPTPDLVATQVAVMQSAAATLTSGAPTLVVTVAPTQTDTATVAPTSTPTPTQTPAPTATQELQPSPRPPTATPSPPAIGPSVGTFAVVGVYFDDLLNVRSGPGVASPVVGTVPYYGRDVEMFAGGRQIDSAWWAPIRHGNLEGWVNSNYLARQVGQVSDPVASLAARAILAIRDHDMAELAGLVHPVKGVMFSPYTYVRPLQGAPGAADLVFSPAQLEGLWSDTTVYQWGTFDGSGEPIQMSFRQYYDRFVYDVDFAQPDVVGFDATIGQGNTINNIAIVYPIAVTVEYHFEGFDPQYAGMDWRSLRLVIEEYGGTWYVVGIVHDEWTV